MPNLLEDRLGLGQRMDETVTWMMARMLRINAQWAVMKVMVFVVVKGGSQWIADAE